MRKSIIGGLGVGLGMAIFVAVSLPTGEVRAPSLLAWASALAGITALIMLSAFVALRARGIANVIWLAAATAVIYTLMAAGILSGLFGQSAFNAGPLSLSLPVIDTVEPVCSVILAAAVFHEHLARSPGLLAFQLAGGAIAAAGIALLSHSPVVLAEERRQFRSARLPQNQRSC